MNELDRIKFQKTVIKTSIDNLDEYIRDRFIMLMMHKNRVKNFKSLDKMGLLYDIIPEFKVMKNIPAGHPNLHPEKDIYIHTIAALSHLKRDTPLHLILAVLLHDIGKPITRNEYH